MEKMPTTGTQEEIDFFVKGLHAPDTPVNTQFAVMAFLGMCRHEYMSADWIICQFAWEESLCNILRQAGKRASDTIRDRIEQTYCEKGYSPIPTW